jgi:UTP--glucose-1-phosphate uridylyltransferase
VNQSPPLGFGHAVLQAKSYTEDEDFFVVAGDTFIISEGIQHLRRLMDCYEQENADAAFLLLRVDHPEHYGIAHGTEHSHFVHVKKVIEKPSVSDSNLAIMPIYVFKNTIFDHLKKLAPGKANEIQLTDAIQSAISGGKVVIGVHLKKEELMLDIGSPDTYFKAQTDSYNYGIRRKDATGF